MPRPCFHSSHYEKFLATGEVKCIDHEIPFEIPAGWAWCKIKHICTMQAGKNISASKIFAEYSELHPYRCVGGNGLRGYTESYNTSGHYSIVGRQGALCGCLNIENGDFYATEHAVVVDAYDIVPTTFIYYFLTALNLNQYATATAQPGLAVSNIIEVMFPLPPIQEQQRIVEQIKLIMPLVNKYEQSRSKLDSLNKTIYTQLKKSILQEAIQGRLVPQDPNDESASVLLERIKEEKTKLLKAGKLKKKDLVDSVIFKGDDNKYYERIDGNLLDISDEVPFDLPDSWVWARLSSVCNMFTGNSISEKDKSTYFTGVSGMQYIGTKDVRFDNSIDYKNGIAIPDIFLPNFKIAPSGSVLMCIEGGSAGRKVGQTDRDVCFGNKLCCFSSFSGYQRYLYYYIQSPSFVESFQKNKTGIIGGVSVNSLKNLLIAIPPIKEQVRIAQHVAETLSCL